MQSGDIATRLLPFPKDGIALPNAARARGAIPPPLQRGRPGGGGVSKDALRRKAHLPRCPQHPHRPRCARPLPPLKRGKDILCGVRPFRREFQGEGRVIRTGQIGCCPKIPR